MSHFPLPSCYFDLVEHQLTTFIMSMVFMVLVLFSVLKFRTILPARTQHVLQEIGHASLKIVTSVSTTATVALGTVWNMQRNGISQTGRSSVQNGMLKRLRLTLLEAVP